MTQDCLFPDAKKKRFLASLTTPEGKYGIYRGSPHKYAGGKSRAVGYILESIPDSASRVVSLFCGGASVEIALANELDMEVVAYDIFDVLVNYWNWQIKDPEGLAFEISKLMPPTETMFAKAKYWLAYDWKRKPQLTLDRRFAAYYWYNHNLSYGPLFLGYQSEKYKDAEIVQRMIDKVKATRIKDMHVHERGFQHVLPERKDDFIYADPPYYLGAGSTVKQGMYPNPANSIYHDGFAHEALRDGLMAHRGGFVLCYNDHALIRQWYAPFCDIRAVKWQYSMGIGAAGENQDVKKESSEIIITPKGQMQ